MRRDTACAALIAAITAAGCGDIETTGNNERDARAAPGERPPVDEKFVQEPYGVGSSWFAYSRSDHTVTPRERIYRIRRGQLDALLEVTSYYDDRGESGHVTLRSRLRGDGGWGQARTLSLSENIKEQSVCLTLDPLEEHPCGDSNADLVFRTDLRSLPSAGFAVSNPAMYVTGHRAGSAASPEISQIEAETITSLPSPLRETPLVDARFSPDQSAVGSPGHVHLQATADMRLAQWQLTEITESEERVEATLRSRCVELAESSDEQTPVSEGETGTAEVSVPTDDDYAVALVDVCDRSVVERTGTPYGARWPSTDTFDLFVEQVDGRLIVRVAPGHLIRDWTAGPGEGSTDLESVEIPDDLWDQ